MAGDGRPFIERFYDSFTPEPMSGCWLWTKTANAGGYGSIRMTGPHMLAHRASWTEFNGPIPEGMLVLHRCDNPACVNPDHLYVGDQSRNMADCSSRRRTGPHRHPASYRGVGGRRNAKLCDKHVRAMRVARKSGEPVKKLAEQYGVTTGHVYKVTNARIWRWVEEE